MSTNLLSCRNCGAALDPRALGQPLARCRTCDNRFRLYVFPAAFRNDRNGAPGKPLAEAGQSTCFYHEQHQAEAVCDHCGRYLCAVCGITNFGGNLCTVCLSKMTEDPENHRFRLYYPRYDRLVLGLAVLPIILTFFTIFTAPAALALGFYGWNKSYNPVRQYRGTLVLGMIIASAQIAFWIVALGGAISSAF